ncbi:MAG: ABC-ATPase domain-containing protein [bacterium]
MNYPTSEDLRRILARIDGRGYKAYKEIRGAYSFPGFSLFIDHVQGDPFAAPSRFRVRVPQDLAGYPVETFTPKARAVALCTYLTEEFARNAHQVSARRGSGKSGIIRIDAPGQEILERTAMDICPAHVEARFVVGLPADGRRVKGREAIEMLCRHVPAIVAGSLLYAVNDRERIERYIRTNEDAEYLRHALGEQGLVGFVADGSILPRRSGVDDRPLCSGTVIPFRSPESLRHTFSLPNHGPITGLGIPRGVTLIVGGGFHGKSTLLNALELGIYNHKPGDGRECVVTDSGAVKIRAEDGRRVWGVNISPFIGNLPFGQDTAFFCTENASGSTSQAANIIEALEVGASVLMLDEDTAATNFMIRDHRMQELVDKGKEPITPFIDKVRQLYQDLGVSTVLVIGGSGDYFDVADTVIALEDYVPHDATERARAIAQKYRAERRPEGGTGFGRLTPRIPLSRSIDPSRGRREVDIKTRGLRLVQFGEETIDLGAVEQLTDYSQTRALGDALLYAREHSMDGRATIREILDAVMADIERSGLDVLNARPVGDYAMFRKFELAAALNRIRTLDVKHP